MHEVIQMKLLDDSHKLILDAILAAVGGELNHGEEQFLAQHAKHLPAVRNLFAAIIRKRIMATQHLLPGHTFFDLIPEVKAITIYKSVGEFTFMNAAVSAVKWPDTSDTELARLLLEGVCAMDSADQIEEVIRVVRSNKGTKRLFPDNTNTMFTFIKTDTARCPVSVARVRSGKVDGIFDLSHSRNWFPIHPFMVRQP